MFYMYMFSFSLKLPETNLLQHNITTVVITKEQSSHHFAEESELVNSDHTKQHNEVVSFQSCTNCNDRMRSTVTLY